jgi:hypothetical protein
MTLYPVKFLFLTIIICTVFSALVPIQLHAQEKGNSIEIGMGRVNITPDHPVRLTGYGSRKNVFDSVEQALWAKTLVLSQKDNKPMVWVTMDLVGIPGFFSDELFNRLKNKIGLVDRAQLMVSVTHTHNGPETGVLLNIFGETLPPNQLADVKLYRDDMLNKIEKSVIDAYNSRVPGNLSWAQGSASFAMNRRVIENGKWKDFGETPGGPVDRDLPVLKATDKNGRLLALVINYACHGTTLVPEHNFVHGDWMGSTQQMIEEKFLGTNVMVALGCAGDANPSPRGEFKHVNQNARMVTNEVDRLMSENRFVSLSSIPHGKIKFIDLTFEHVPDAKELVEQSKMDGAYGLYARKSLESLANGGSISSTMSYPIQVWTFGNQLAIISLGGEVVVDYSLRIKKEFKNNKIWVNAYSNDISTYIASKRLYPEGGYEVDGSMPYYNHPSRLTIDTEEKILKAIHELMPSEFK